MEACKEAIWVKRTQLLYPLAKGFQPCSTCANQGFHVNATNQSCVRRDRLNEATTPQRHYRDIPLVHDPRDPADSNEAICEMETFPR
jgi:hypothetical protein